MAESAASPKVIAQLVETMRTLAGPIRGFVRFTPRESSARVCFALLQERAL